MRELVEDGVTGFLVDTVDDAVDAIARIHEIDRGACRARIAARFTVDHMADRYLSLYRSLLG
jgi:glycosyltransferase involved in cell wall biosynthesis